MRQVAINKVEETKRLVKRFLINKDFYNAEKYIIILNKLTTWRQKLDHKRTQSYPSFYCGLLSGKTCLKDRKTPLANRRTHA